MRIIAGEAKGRNLKSPTGRQTRPTSDRVKESMFNILGDRVPDARVLDLFAGTGNLGLEAISRGAKLSVFIDDNRDSIKIIYDNIKLLKYESCCEVYHNNALSALNILNKKDKSFDIIFIDPPYHSDIIPKILETISEAGIMSEYGVIISEHDIKDYLPEKVLNMERYRYTVYGDTALSFYKRT